MLTETLRPVDQQIENAEFITPLDAYNKYCKIGGRLSLRSWVDAKNNGADFDFLRAQLPPQGEDPLSRYIRMGGEVNPYLFYQVNEQAFDLHQAYYAHPDNRIFHSEMRQALCKYAPISEQSHILMEKLMQQGLYTPEEIRFLYYQIETLDQSMPAIGSAEQIHVELGQIPELHKLMDTSRMAAALTGNAYLSAYQKQIAEEMKIPKSVQPWNLCNIELQIETFLMQGKLEEAKDLRDSLPKPPQNTVN